MSFQFSFMIYFILLCLGAARKKKTKRQNIKMKSQTEREPKVREETKHDGPRFIRQKHGTMPHNCE